MSKPKIFATCPAGCLWETIHKTDLEDGTIKATFDGAGNNIAQTYLPKNERVKLINYYPDDKPTLISDTLYYIGLAKKSLDYVAAICVNVTEITKGEENIQYHGIRYGVKHIDIGTYADSTGRVIAGEYIDFTLTGGGITTTGDGDTELSVGIAKVKLLHDTNTNKLYLLVKGSKAFIGWNNDESTHIAYNGMTNGEELTGVSILYLGGDDEREADDFEAALDIEQRLAALETAVEKANSNDVIYAVETAEEMDEILVNATADDVGKFYMYIGTTTGTYDNGAVYQIGEA